MQLMYIIIFDYTIKSRNMMKIVYRYILYQIDLSKIDIINEYNQIKDLSQIEKEIIYHSPSIFKYIHILISLDLYHELVDLYKKNNRDRNYFVIIMNVILENAMFNINSSTLEEFDCDEVEYLFIKKIMYDFYLHGEFTLIPNTNEAISFIFSQFIQAGFASITLNSIYCILLQ